MSSGGLASTITPMDSSFATGSKASTLLSSRSSHQKSKPRPNYQMENLEGKRISRSHVPTPLSGFDEANSNSVVDYKRSPIGEIFNFKFKATRKSVEDDVGTLRPDIATNFSHIRRSTPENPKPTSSSGSDRTNFGIRRTTEWVVTAESPDSSNSRNCDGILRVENCSSEQLDAV